MTWKVVLSRQAAKDAKKLAQAGYKPQAEQLLRLLEQNPFENLTHAGNCVKLSFELEQKGELEHVIFFAIA